MKPLANQDGMALLLVLVVVALLSALLTEFSFSTLVDLRATETFRDRTKAFYLARGGVEAARMILQEDQNAFDHPSEFWGDLPSIPVEDGDVSLQIRDLTGLFNLNEIADNNGNQQWSYHAFVALCEEVGIDQGEAGQLGIYIRNWLNRTRNHPGTLDDDNYYAQLQPPYARKGANLETLDELNLVRGFEGEVIRKLRPYIRVGEKFPINVNTAPRPVLYAWQHDGVRQILLDPEDIDALVSYRRQTPFQKFNDLASVAGIGNRWSAAWQVNSVGVQGQLYEVSSTGRINQGTREALAIVLKNGNKLVSLKVE